MNKSSFIQEEDSSVKKAPTLVRRVSDMFKADGAYSGPPSLFSQKIRHCCQNLNLFPYLLYSFENSKSHPIAKKVNLCFDIIVRYFIQRLLFVYSSVRQTLISCLQQKSLLSCKSTVEEQKSSVKVNDRKSRLSQFHKQKPKHNPVLLVVAIYLVPLILAFQLVGLFSLLFFGKYTPGFIFLVASLMFLGYISMKVMFHETISAQRKKQETMEKRKKE